MNELVVLYARLERTIEEMFWFCRQAQEDDHDLPLYYEGHNWIKQAKTLKEELREIIRKAGT